jgi:hypothetical protein
MLRLVNIVTVLLTLLVSDAFAQGSRERRDRDAVFELVLLGEREVDLRRERDTLDVSYAEEWYRERSFRALQFYAGRNDIEMYSLRITYINGFSEEFQVNRTISRNGQIQVDLDGGRSYIRRIEMSYRAQPEGGRQALIRVYGEPGRVAGPGTPPPDADSWVRLGCRDAKVFSFDSREQIIVDRRLDAVRIRVIRVPVEIRSLRVVYANGASEDVISRPRTFQVGQTQELRLKAWEDLIDRIEFNAHTLLEGGLPAAGARPQLGSVCASGQPARR